MLVSLLAWASASAGFTLHGGPGLLMPMRTAAESSVAVSPTAGADMMVADATAGADMMVADALPGFSLLAKSGADDFLETLMIGLPILVLGTFVVFILFNAVRSALMGGGGGKFD